VYQSYDLTTAKFNVSVEDITLLTGFEAKNITVPMLKEYLVNITRNILTLSFEPFSNLAFINAIEIMSVPDSLIADSAQTINPTSTYLGLSGQAFETVYRVNMGIPKVTPDNDTLWRTWTPDASFIQNLNLTQWVSMDGKPHYEEGRATAESAPSIVYTTATEIASSNTTMIGARFNITWKFDLQEGYTYMLRFHFCDIVSKAANQLLFDVYVGPWAVLTDYDMSTLTYGSLATPLFEDFILSAKDSTSKLSISIGPSKLPNILSNGLLNGLEIFKFIGISGANTIVSRSGSRVSLGTVLGLVGGAVILFLVIVILLGAIRKRRLKRTRSSKMRRPFSVDGFTKSHCMTRNSGATTVTLGGQNGSFGYRFGLSVLLEATNNFDENWVIGVGGFGKVYHGTLRDGTRVAVKRGNTQSHQGINEFRTEIELLSRLRHRHLVSLVGYCDERNEMILVYEYMEKGTLKSHLYGLNLPPLTWKQRLEICIGSARGLHYLHTGPAKTIIHRDVKSANILLDENLMAKITDFGLSKTGPELDQTYVSTAVKGTIGYLDPEYFTRQQLTEKSDVYSFGVVLLEVLCARPVIDRSLPKEMVNLVDWAMKYIQRGELFQIVDPEIAASIQPDSLRKFGETAEKCLADDGSERPTMGDVLWHLEYALQLQQIELDESCVDY
jgi:Protein tyrosine and serine/threonine kinase/Malectin-like domain